MSSRFTEHFDIVHPNAQAILKSFAPHPTVDTTLSRGSQHRSNTFSSTSSESSTSSSEFSFEDKKVSLAKRFMSISRRK
ncbi:hypothetical protein INT44_008546 [Umbelopsis vinacea]|uniref:Uncharacterized protein n=1 Tax=Umbelopsis vinacea TaxID=44442 RepID=A0A8H7UDK6_9FUNG|nr:hypothetical protein INT44_008546 [Umbelopsis vinacea]